MKLNIGSANYGPENYVNIDNDLSLESYIENPKSFIFADGEYLPFKDNTFDKIHSNQCVGTYLHKYDDIIRVLKKGGTVQFSLYNRFNEISKLIGNLIKREIKITSVEWMNGHFDDVDEDDAFSLIILGKK
jgi:SAM-dependent methyltransferase